MNEKLLWDWLSEPQTALTHVVTRCVREHVRGLHSRGIRFYGFALLPGEHYDINNIVAAHNCESDIKVPGKHEDYRYYRYSVDEWEHYEPEGFEAVNQLLREANLRFASLHSKQEGDYVMDDFEIAHSNSLLEALLCGLEAAKAEGVFGTSEPFLVMWISDSGNDIMMKSVRHLNSAGVARAFKKEFGS